MKLLFLDTETGGLNPSVNSLLQAGLVAYDDGEILDKIEFTIKEDCYNINAFALKFNGLDLYEDIYKNGITKNDAVKEIIDFISKNFDEIPILVGHNPSIDKYMIKELFNQCDLDMEKYISHRMIDTMSLIWGLHIVNKLPFEACSSDGAFKYFNISVAKRHHALDDCIATVELYEELIKLLEGEFE